MIFSQQKDLKSPNISRCQLGPLRCFWGGQKKASCANVFGGPGPLERVVQFFQCRVKPGKTGEIPKKCEITVSSPHQFMT